ncbi:hypothetical protein ACJIZ3_019891 [Penstemon smallii]|uniref:C2 domain-containing protein n=1 Tax=Penstemon smallii TaxID=265156 RepID=A0ABD3T2G4_9LAMI
MHDSHGLIEGPYVHGIYKRWRFTNINSPEYAWDVVYKNFKFRTVVVDNYTHEIPTSISESLDGSTVEFLVLYVDDILLIGNDVKAVYLVRERLCFDVKFISRSESRLDKLNMKKIHVKYQMPMNFHESCLTTSILYLSTFSFEIIFVNLCPCILDSKGIFSLIQMGVGWRELTQRQLEVKYFLIESTSILASISRNYLFKPNKGEYIQLIVQMIYTTISISTFFHIDNLTSSSFSFDDTLSTISPSMAPTNHPRGNRRPLGHLKDYICDNLYRSTKFPLNSNIITKTVFINILVTRIIKKLSLLTFSDTPKVTTKKLSINHSDNIYLRISIFTNLWNSQTLVNSRTRRSSMSSPTAFIHYRVVPCCILNTVRLPKGVSQGALIVPVVPLGALLAAAYPLSSRPPYVLSWLNDLISAEDMMHPELNSPFFGIIILSSKSFNPNEAILFNQYLFSDQLRIISLLPGTIPAKLLLQLTTSFKEGGLRDRMPILDVLAGGGKVHVSCCMNDLTVKMKLHSLKIMDELQGPLSSNSQYLACSGITDHHSLSSPNNLEAQVEDLFAVAVEEDDIFKDDLPDFMSLPDSGKIVPSDVFYEALGSDDSDFVCVTFFTRNPGSPDYNGIDTQMSVRMSKLEFYCNRLTLVALINFGFDLSSTAYSGVSVSDVKNPEVEPSAKKDMTEDHGHASIKGLLGHGKGRVVFYLNMNVDNVTMFLNKEDGSQLAMFVQESFLLDIKVHPSSTSIGGTLGNFRLCDLSLGTDNCWGWLCDLRNQEAESLIQFTFNSYSIEDDDYEGYDYSLNGRLSAVRIVFLYRFVQEITAYFMELATPHTEEAIKLVYKVGGIEWLIQKYEVDGAAAVKLDLSFGDSDYSSSTKFSEQRVSFANCFHVCIFMQLDLGHLRITNAFSWHGCPENDTSAVHLDVLDAEIFGINMAVGINGLIGKAMIRAGKEVHVYVRRCLRDVFRKVPTFSMEVGSLHAVMSDKEYNVIFDCFYMNLCEQPNLPPSFRSSKSAAKDTIKLLADKVNMNSQVLLSRTVTIVAVGIDYALLELCYGADEGSPLAHVILEGLWVSYRMTSLSEADLYITIPKFSILDFRPSTKPEMRLMLGSCTDVPKQMSPERNADLPNSTMFLMDARWRLSSQSFVLRVQQPRVLVVPDFLLAVGEFFVPALGTITGREEMMDPKNDPISKNNSIVLSAPLYKQIEDIVQLSPGRQLVADTVGIDEYIYDGCGNIICLTDEKEVKEFHASVIRPIIIIGRGKRLRFVNVKFENGLLLRKYTYLSNDSCYSVSQEDGVDISFVDNNSRNRNSKNTDPLEELSDAVDASGTVHCQSSKMPSFSFEAQVVSPEFTFYDSSKSFLDDSTHGEKLLRAKTDFSFMAFSRILPVEAGSGLVVLDSVDMSWGYTSVKDKTSISLMSSDIYAHLSLSVISHILNLQSQASTALQFGNADPLSPCTNFDRIWVSPKENERLSNMTFWRPRAPSNYVILGDCVTSRPNPPSQSVLAVSNTYGRVRKPLGFKLIGLFSSIQGQKTVEVHLNIDSDCSLWLPVAPPGYLALGCVAHVGNQPPPNHIVHCIRSDLVTSTAFLECILNTSANHSFETGFSIWRLDNCLGSFYAHQSSCRPSKDFCFDLNHLLLWNSNQRQSTSNESLWDLNTEQENAYPQATNQGATSSGWDILRSISKATTCYMSIPNFERIWWDRGGDLRRPFSIWRPVLRAGYAILGDCITEGLEPPSLGIIFKADDPEVSARPVQFTKVAHIGKKGPDEAFFWYPIAPPGYDSLGCVVSRHDEAPCLESFCCPRMDLVSQANIAEMPISRSSSSKASNCWSIWKVENQACTFLARSDLKKPSSRLAFAIGDAVKPKTKDNVTAEMKIRCFSLTILDGFCGMMTPLFDATITNIKLATHGRLEAMNAVLVSSFAASTFNINLEAWEPLVEPFDGIFKLETYDTDLKQPVIVGKRMRIAATSILNVNLSAANVDTLAQTMDSWRKQRELEEKAMRLIEEATGSDASDQKSTHLALDEDDFQALIVENQLGRDIYLKNTEHNFDTVGLLPHDDCAAIWIPPPRYSDRFNVSDESREPRCYVGIQIVEAKGLPLLDDGNSHQFFCALRLVVENQDANPQKLFPQSARTKCIKPVTNKVDDLDEGTATWNELFIFEVPRKGMAKMEVEVTNLAAKAGKGEVVGACSFSVGHGMSILKKVASVKMLHQTSDVPNFASYQLKRRGQHSDEMHSRGCLFVSSSYVEKSTVTDIGNDQRDGSELDGDVGFWVSVGPGGPWDGFRSLLLLSVSTRKLKDDFVALEVSMKNGKKHAKFRALAMVNNDSDIKLDISTCHISTINDSDDWARTNQNFLDITLNPGCCRVLPWRSMFKNSNQCLRIRPSFDRSQTSYAWGRPVSVEKDSLSSDQGALSRQNTLKHNKTPISPLRLDQLEKKDLLWCCPSNSGRLFWLSIGTDASILQTDLNIPVYDWKISASSPLKLENRLPCSAEFKILERLGDGKNIERQQGLVSSRGTVHIYSADIRNPIYIMLRLQGGWVMEKDLVLILDMTNGNHVSSFSMLHRQRKRRLRVSIERDFGGTAATPKTLRFFIPYWIHNESFLSLAYKVVEIEPLESADVDSLVISKAVKSAKSAVKYPSTSAVGRQVGMRKNIQVLEAIEDTSPIPSMLTPQDYVGRGGVLLFSSRNDAYLSPRVGISVAIRNSENFSPGVSLLELEKKQRVDLRAFNSDGTYYKLSAVLHMTSDRTKVVHFQPHTMFINRAGCSICMQQCDTQLLEWLHPTDPPKHFGWLSAKAEFLKLRMEGYQWSTPFFISSEGLMSISLRSDSGSDEMHLSVEVRGGAKTSRYEVILCPSSFSSPYRIENRSFFLPIRFRQVHSSKDSWRGGLRERSGKLFYKDHLHKSNVPVLAVAGDRDLICPPEADYGFGSLSNSPFFGIIILSSKSFNPNEAMLFNQYLFSDQLRIISLLPVPQHCAASTFGRVFAYQITVYVLHFWSQLNFALLGGLRDRSGKLFYKDHLHKSNVPVLAVAGDRDLICPPEAVYGLFPNHVLVVIVITLNISGSLSNSPFFGIIILSSKSFNPNEAMLFNQYLFSDQLRIISLLPGTIPAKLLLQLTTSFKEGGLRDRTILIVFLSLKYLISETAKLIPEHLVTYKVSGEPNGPHYAHYDLVGGRMVLISLTWRVVIVITLNISGSLSNSPFFGIIILSSKSFNPNEAMLFNQYLLSDQLRIISLLPGTIPAKLLLQLTTSFKEGGLRDRSGKLFYKDHLHKSNVPVLAVAGDRDLICPPEAVYGLFPNHLLGLDSLNSTLFIPAGCGSTVPMYSSISKQP